MSAKKWLNLLAAAMICFAIPVQADTIFTATLTGDQEVPSVATPGFGTAVVILSTDMLSLSVDLEFQELLSPTVNAHIHCCALPGANANVAVGFVPAGFPLGVTSGSFSSIFDLTDVSIYGGAFLSENGGTAEGARTALIKGLTGGEAYVNIHSTQFSGGEIRGQLVPEPATAGLLSIGVAGIVMIARRRNRAR